MLRGLSINSQVLFLPCAQFCPQSCTLRPELETSVFLLQPSWSFDMANSPAYCCDKILTKSNSGTERFISAYSLQSIVKGSQGRNLKAGTEVEAIEERCLLACFSWFVQLMQPRIPCPVVAHHSGLGLPTSTMNLEHAPQIHLRANLMETIS